MLAKAAQIDKPVFSATVFVSLFMTCIVAVTGMISSSNRPTACAAAVRCCDCRA